MKIGFTGTQKGMTEEQIFVFYNFLKEHKDINEFHHGQCIGADIGAHRIIRGQHHILLREKLSGFLDTIKIIIHPPTDRKKVGRIELPFEEREPKPYLERNKDIVNESDLLIACPKSNKEELRSGTWATIRYARKVRKKVVIIYPNGEVK
ncbi:MAG: hypothetical protein AABY22_26430 [Nanoarchaeota archaeon]